VDRPEPDLEVSSRGHAHSRSNANLRLAASPPIRENVRSAGNSSYERAAGAALRCKTRCGGGGERLEQVAEGSPNSSPRLISQSVCVLVVVRSGARGSARDVASWRARAE